MEGAFLEVLGRPREIRVELDRERITVGKASTNDAPLPWDSTVSRLHAVVERFPSGWCIRDMGSRNGTYLNGERISGERVLRPGDEIRVGETRISFRMARGADVPTPTSAAEAAPELTRRERDVLIALCRPVLTRTILAEPAGIRDIAAELVLSESAVKKHIGRLFDKFTILDPQDRRRGHLVSEAIRRGAVSITDL